MIREGMSHEDNMKDWAEQMEKIRQLLIQQAVHKANQTGDVESLIETLKELEAQKALSK